MPSQDAHKRQDSASNPSESRATAGAETNFILFDLRALTQFDARRPHVVTLSDTGSARLLLITFRAGQTLEPRPMASEISAQALRGRLRLRVGAASAELMTGRLAQLEAHTTWRVEALTDAVALLSLAPSPGEDALGPDLQGDGRPLITRA